MAVSEKRVKEISNALSKKLVSGWKSEAESLIDGSALVILRGFKVLDIDEVVRFILGAKAKNTRKRR